MFRVLNEFGKYSSNKDRFKFWKKGTARQHLIAQSISEEESTSVEKDPGVRDDLFKLPSQPDVPRTIILHTSFFKTGWNWLILLLVIYVAVFTPYAAAFHYNYVPENQVKVTKKWKDILAEPFVITDIVVDIMFMLDMLVNFRTTYIHNGEIVTDPKKIAYNYLKTWFLIDMVSAIPFDFILERAGTSDTATVTGIFKTPRLLRLLRVARKMDQYSEYGATVLGLLMALYTLIAHWLACIFYAIAWMERPHLEHPISWLDMLAEKTKMPYVLNDTSSGPDTSSKYITSLYFTFTLLASVGFGNVAPVTNNEKIFSILAMMVGSLMSACIFGNVSTIMLRLYQGTEAYLDKQNQVKEFMKFNHVDRDLSKRLLQYTEEEWWQTGGVDLNKVMTCFTDGLQADVTLHLNQSLFHSHAVFDRASPGCLRALSRKMKQMQSVPGDYLLNDGDKVDYLYFLTQGRIEISKEGLVVAILSRNDVFGDNILDALKRPRDKCAKSVYDIRTISYTDTTKIHINDLIFILQSYPEFSSTFLTKFTSLFVITTEAKIPVIKGWTSVQDVTSEEPQSNPEFRSQSVRAAKLKAAGLSTIADEAEEEDESAEIKQDGDQINNPPYLEQNSGREDENPQNLSNIDEKKPAWRNIIPNKTILDRISNGLPKLNMGNWQNTPRTGLDRAENFIFNASPKSLPGNRMKSLCTQDAPNSLDGGIELRRSNSAVLPFPGDSLLMDFSPVSVSDGNFNKESDDTYSGTVSLCWDNTDIRDFSSTDPSNSETGHGLKKNPDKEFNSRLTVPEAGFTNVTDRPTRDENTQDLTEVDIQNFNARIEEQLDVINRRMERFSRDLDETVAEIMYHLQQLV